MIRRDRAYPEFLCARSYMALGIWLVQIVVGHSFDIAAPGKRSQVDVSKSTFRVEAEINMAEPSSKFRTKARYCQRVGT